VQRLEQPVQVKAYYGRHLSFFCSFYVRFGQIVRTLVCVVNIFYGTGNYMPYVHYYYVSDIATRCRSLRPCLGVFSRLAMCNMTID